MIIPCEVMNRMANTIYGIITEPLTAKFPLTNNITRDNQQGHAVPKVGNSWNFTEYVGRVGDSSRGRRK